MFEQNYAQQPYGMNPMMGAMPQPTNTYRVNNILSADEIDLLQNQGSKFSLGLTNEEMLRAVCNHRSKDGLSDALVYDDVTGVAQCTICGYKFRPIEADIDYDRIKDDINRVEDILQTTKLMYLDLPAEAAKDYYPIIGLLEKLPQLVEFASKNLAKHDNYRYMYDNRNMGTVAMFQNLANMFSATSPVYGAPYQQPQQPNYGFYNQPAGFPQAAFPQQPQMNPFGYAGTPQPQYAPGTPTNFVYNPQQVTPAPAPAAPAAAPEATVNQTVNV